MKILTLSLSLVVASLSAAAPATDPLPNREPLAEIPFTALPLGSIAANGWLLGQLDLQREASIGADVYRGYYAGISAETNEVILGEADGTWHPLATASMPLDPSQWCEMRVVAKGPLLQVFVDDRVTPRLEISDDSFTHGQVGVRRYTTDPEKNAAGFTAVRAIGL